MTVDLGLLTLLAWSQSPGSLKVDEVSYIVVPEPVVTCCRKHKNKPREPAFIQKLCQCHGHLPCPWADVRGRVNATDTDHSTVALTRDARQISVALAQFLYPWH